jgi:hypothetical protein
LAELLQSGDIGKLLAQAAEQRRLVTEIRASLPADEAEHVVTARTDDTGRLVVGVDSAAWAARVRYRVQELGSNVQVRVVPRGADRG